MLEEKSCLKMFDPKCFLVDASLERGEKQKVGNSANMGQSCQFPLPFEMYAVFGFRLGPKTAGS